jgi:hypothetical protein
MAQDAGPLGNLAARQTGRQRASLPGKGESATSARESQERTQKLLGLQGKGSKQELPALFPDFISPNLNSPLNKETIPRNVASIRCIWKLQSQFIQP